MAFHTPHGSTRFRLPWSWSAFDYRELCAALWEQCGDARFEVAKVEGATRRTAVHTDRGDLTAPLIVDALGWRRVLGPGPNVQPPDALISRGLEVHPHDGQGDDLDIWIERGVVRQGYALAVPADGERRIGVGSYEPRDHVKEPTVAMARPARRRAPSATRATGSRTRCARPRRTACSSSATAPGHCLPLSGEGIRTAFYFGIAAGRELRAVLAGEQDRDAGARELRRVLGAPRAAPSASRCGLQRLIPALPPRVLTALLALMGRARPCRRAFTWYLGSPTPRSPTEPDRLRSPHLPRIGRPWTTPSPSTSAVSSRASSRTGASGEVLTLAYMNARGARAHARDGRAAPLEPLARGALAQGRDVGQHAGGEGAALRLRRRRRARARRARRPRLPHRRAHLLPPRRARAAGAARGRCPASSARSPTAPPRATRAAPTRPQLLADPAFDRREGPGGGRGGRPRRPRGDRRARRRGGRRRALPPRRAAALARPHARRRRGGARCPPSLTRSSIAPALESSPRGSPREHNLVPSAQTLHRGLRDAGLRLPEAARRRPAFLLESAEQGQRVGRWSFIGYKPRTVLRWRLADGGDPVRARRRGGAEHRQAPLAGPAAVRGRRGRLLRLRLRARRRAPRRAQPRPASACPTWR